jgi:hypothetical protein
METLMLPMLTDHSFGRRTHLNRAAPAVVWICILSFSLAGCYSSMAIDHQGAEREKMYSERVKYVITSENTRYEFNYSAPEISEDFILGMADFRTAKGPVTRQVLIPLTNVVTVGVREFQPVTTAVAVISIPLAIVAIMGLISPPRFTIGP